MTLGGEELYAELLLVALRGGYSVGAAVSDIGWGGTICGAVVGGIAWGS